VGDGNWWNPFSDGDSYTNEVLNSSGDSSSGYSLPGSLASLAGAIDDAGSPRKWVFSRITEFMIGLVIGTVTSIADRIAEAFAAVADAYRFAGSQAMLAWDTAGDAGISVLDEVLGWFGATADVAGPLGPVVYIVGAVVILALLWRATKAVSDSIPVVSSIVAFLEGSG
jgi:hypothetical protein